MSQFRRDTEKVTSILEIFNITSGERRVIKEFPYLIEAPDWTSDGKWLVYNSEGLIYKLSVNPIGEPLLIDTDFATKCNNDHIVSPDGKYLAISHRSLPEGKPTIFILPFEGGRPKQVTPPQPSYLHGWSPDGNSLTYCANRNGEMDVYTIKTNGTNEQRLTIVEGLNDGPEYSPDGKYIWFNSVRSGLMQIWRMRTDGSEQTQMTFDDDRNSWFPHISPDGKHVVYIAYRKGDLEPHEHLRYKNVELRIMPTEGGEPRTLAKLFGGQGSFNVNSWAPDSKQFAFVSYRIEN
ncbi:TolB family protein [Dysgonomonas sp. Marseille-P4677]|uniref:TolB family protein n=1 Tax=Dysgonomonas sp. Marseille-P4677 TaxID=2364790 RepID=UPI0019117F15|nr:PD40 domain-containing protein [Dysgonomonas sp. Marseille-P4677]MBK5720551.1 TolB family protein [Dysgonomonas sp. Marseille-P4677]